MNAPAPAPEPKPKRSRRMVVWMIAVPIVILLLALAGANWKTFHLAYCKHLMSSTDLYEQGNGIATVLETHIRRGMSLEEVRAILAPARLTELSSESGVQSRYREFTVSLEGSGFYGALGFDENDRLAYYDRGGLHD